MAYVIGCLMAALSFLLNKILLKYVGMKAVISYSPVVEEVTKSLCSYYLAADIIVTHVVFGMLEAGYDWYNTADGQRGKWAALFSIIGHSLFGCLTFLALYISSSIWIAILVASCVHVMWNVTLIRLSSQK
ncbi:MULTISPECIES: hypothetical protein [Pelosinus]|jgi:hypothetical protein|uniref:Uncharacterized protein n=1 Tax=Pelosinus fermentans B4 TaxID=1149862 RepID=I9LGN2_9FIRM|nr:MULTISPECIES: hypothetical protein [Pelosinus]EIW19526.1 hypothetical protein FB4_2709 [Pelosinus fermentans B4]EIW24741.1 hypothetical protein FA11_3132 [Pelosinus fermentans A11]OAM95978.1 hypothetical protein FR7_04000 [Pelosinus fermentans DSM 17108]SDR34982.1 hypothetical protein SAMN04515679_4168 [Pelosinus fermentans]